MKNAQLTFRSQPAALPTQNETLSCLRPLCASELAMVAGGVSSDPIGGVISQEVANPLFVANPLYVGQGNCHFLL